MRRYNTTPGGAIFEWVSHEHKTIMYDCKGGFHKIPVKRKTCVLCRRRMK